MNQKAAELSKDGETRFVVYVPDQGEEVFSAEQLSIYRAFVFVQAAFLNGKQIAA